MRTKTFDCVEMKRRAAARIYQETRNLSPEQNAEYWRHQNEVLREEQEEARRRRQS